MTVVCLDGEHDIATLPLLTDTMARAMSADHSDVIVDLSEVTFLSAATLDELIRSRNMLHLEARTLTLRAPSRSALRVLDACGLTELVGL